MVNTAYPAPIKNVLKAAPVMVIFMGFGLAFCTTVYDVIYHPKDRIEKFHFRSGKFERLVRKRDEKLRHYYYPAINWQPNDSASLIDKKPLNRY
jgi:hypothetical protein